MAEIDQNQQSETIFEQIAPEVIPDDVATPSDIPVEVPQELTSATLDAVPSVSQNTDNDNKRYIFLGGIAVFFFLFLFLILFFVLGVGRKKTPTTPAAVTLTWWGLWDDQAIIQPLIDAYKKRAAHVTIQYKMMSPSEQGTSYRQLVLSRSANNVGPDIFMLHNSWIDQMKDAQSQSVIAGLPSQVMTVETLKQSFYPIQSTDLVLHNAVIGIPLYIDAFVLFYNTQILQAAGVKSPPTGWLNGVEDIIKKVHTEDANGVLHTSGFALGTANNITHFPEIITMLAYSDGATLQTIKNSSALEVYRKFAEDNYWNDNMPPDVDAFAQSKVAMYIAPTWHAQWLFAKNPKATEFTFAAPVPQGPINKPLTLANYWFHAVSKYSKQQAEAYKFLQFLSTKEAQQLYYDSHMKLRKFGLLPARVDMAQAFTDHRILGAIIDQKDNMLTLPVYTRTSDGGTNDKVTQYFENAVRSTQDGVAYESALNTLQSGLQQVLQTPAR